MSDIIIEKTKTTPYVKFKEDGQLLLQGRSLPENASMFYEPLFDWVDELEIDCIRFELRLEYVNTSSSKRIMELLKGLENNSSIKQIEIRWYFESDDPDMEEQGELFDGHLKRSDFQYLECVDIDY